MAKLIDRSLMALFILLLLWIGAKAVYWLAVPAQNSDASGLRTLAVIAQMVFGFGGAVSLAVHLRRRQRRA